MPTIARRCHTANDVPARKPLYLFSQHAAQIEGIDRHLVLRRATNNPMRFPIVRVSRIICNYHLTWTGTALSLCLREGVPITWVDGYGHALGNTQSRYANPLPFSTLVETYLELPDWMQRFTNWRARRRLETLTTCARRATETGHSPSPLQLTELKRTYVYHGEHPTVFDPEGEAWCYALTVDRLHREQLNSAYSGFNGSRLDLSTELSALLWAELNLDCGIIPASTKQRSVLARLFESWSHQREGRLMLHLGDLKRHLTRELEA